MNMVLNVTNKVYVVEIDDCYDYEAQITTEVFAGYDKALKFYKKKLEEFKKDCCEYDTIEEADDSYLAYDEGWYNRDHYSIRICQKEVQ